MSDSLNLLDFDSVEPVKVVLGGHSFSLRPQSAKVVQQVLELSSVDTARAIAEDDEDTGQGKDPRRFIRDVFSNWDDVAMATALMLGVGPGCETHAADLAFLKEHLSPRVAMAIFEKWWAINEIDAFFSSGGRVLLPMTTKTLLQEIRQARTQAAVEALVAGTEEPEPLTVN